MWNIPHQPIMVIHILKPLAFRLLLASRVLVSLGKYWHIRPRADRRGTIFTCLHQNFTPFVQNGSQSVSRLALEF